MSTITGDTPYVFLALDARGEAVVSSGSPEWPHVAAIVRSLLGRRRGLAGRPPPITCHDLAECPPDFAGCPAYAVLRPNCTSNLDCGEGAHCAWDRYCEGRGRSAEPESTEEEQFAAAFRKATRRARTAKASPR